MMKRSLTQLSTVAAVTFSVALAIPAYCQNPILPPAPTPAPALPSDGLTRESLAEPSAPTHAATTKSSSVAIARKHRRQAEIDPKDFVAIHHPHRHREVAEHHPAGKKPSATVAAGKPVHQRNPAESFVFWWNGWVVRNFHTRNGTVLMDKIGAKS